MRWAVTVALSLLLSCGTAAAQRSLEIRRFDAEIVVHRDASIDVTERIQAHFTGSWNGIYRKIPLEYRTPQGFNWSIRMDLRSATDGEGNELRTETSRQGHYVNYKIWVPGAQDATKTVVLRYRAHNALRFFEEHDELYWNVTGDEWDVPLGMVSALVTLPVGTTGIRATAFSGVQGSTAREAEIEVADAAVRFTMPRPLEFREGLTAVVGWDKGVVSEPTALERTGGFLRSNWPLALPIPVLLGMLALWSRVGRDPRSLPVTVRYEPPERLTPGEAGALTDESVDMRDITATLVDLAVRGFLRIEEVEEEKLFGLIKNREFAFHRLRPRSEWSGLLSHERRVLEGIFDGHGDRVELSELENEFYKSLPGIKDAVMERLVERRLYRSRPDRVRTRWMVGGVFAGFLTGILGSAVSASLSLTPVPFIVAGIVIALIIIVVGYQMPARTVAGARALEGVRGFSEFLERVDKDRYERVVRTPEMFERFLPFAMAFGVERQWARAFADIYTEAPSWYAGAHPGRFNAVYFSNSLSDMSTRTASTMSSAPRSSSGSGFSGGSSGGGGGGGGGGGF